MKIAHISATFPPYMGGTGNACYNYAIELAKMGHEVCVLTRDYGKELIYDDPDTIEIKRFRPLFKFGNAPFIPQIFFMKNYDIIHLHYPFFFGAEIVYLIHKIWGSKYVISYHNDVIYNNGFIGLFLNLYKKTIMRLILDSASKIIVSSFDYAENSDIKSYIKKRGKDLVEISYGVNLDNFSIDESSDKLKVFYKIDMDVRIILFVGSLDKAHHFKGVNNLLKSFKVVLRKSNLDLRLIIVGEGDLKEDYICLSEKLGINDKVLFVGKVKEFELVQYYKMSDLVVLPSTTMGEAFGLVLVEAMALKKPVIASNLPGVRVVVENGFNGFLVKPNDVNDLSDKIILLIENKDIRDKFGENGQNKVKNLYSWPRVSKKLEKIYFEIFNDDSYEEDP